MGKEQDNQLVDDFNNLVRLQIEKAKGEILDQYPKRFIKLFSKTVLDIKEKEKIQLPAEYSFDIAPSSIKELITFTKTTGITTANINSVVLAAKHIIKESIQYNPKKIGTPSGSIFEEDLNFSKVYFFSLRWFVDKNQFELNFENNQTEKVKFGNTNNGFRKLDKRLLQLVSNCEYYYTIDPYKKTK